MSSIRDNQPCRRFSNFGRYRLDTGAHRKPGRVRTARLDKLLGRLFKEEQIFRTIYLARRPCRTSSLPFINSPLPIWRREFVDKIYRTSSWAWKAAGILRSLGALMMSGRTTLMIFRRTMDSRSLSNHSCRAGAGRKSRPSKLLEGKRARGQYEGYDEQGVSKARNRDVFPAESFYK